MTRKFDLLKHVENNETLYLAVECPQSEQEDGWTASAEDFFEFGSIEEAKVWAEAAGVTFTNVEQ